MRRLLKPAIPLFLSFLAASACGVGGSPTGPASETAGAAGAVITGSIRTGSSQLAASAGSAIPGLTVSVAGTSLTSGIDAGGRFNLVGVPTGTVHLQFRGAGVESTVEITSVQASQTVTLVVHVTGSTVAVEAELRSTSGSEEIEGRVESLPPTTAEGTLIVAGRTILTQGSTRIEQGGATRTFADLLIGMRVHVSGTTAGSDVLASAIRIQNTNTWIPVNVHGVVDSLSGDASLFEFNVGSRFIKGDTLTEFFGNGNHDTFARLQDGLTVEIKGQIRDGYIYAERIHIENASSGDEDDGQDQSASIHGTLTAMAGAPPALTLTVGGTTVLTSGSTVVQRRGDVQTLQQLQLGQSLHVVGDRRADGTLDARRIQIDDDAAGGQFEIEGSIGGLSGTCPALSFGINGFRIASTGATAFDGGACSALRNGSRVTVVGVRQADGSVVATRITR